MNILDIILILINIGIVIGSLALIIETVRNCYNFVEGLVMTLTILAATAFIMVFSLLLPFISLDKGSGFTIGTITSVDSNFFGTTSVYVKTSESTQEKYCIESQEVVDNAKEMIGKKVKVSYGERVGFYSTGRCSSAPIEKIEVEE